MSFRMLPTVVGPATFFGLILMWDGIRKRQKRLRAPRITAAELDACEARLQKAALPMARVMVVPETASPPPGSRIGGALWIDSRKRRWPRGTGEGPPMLFLAQINFAEVPPMADFPHQGLLQLFVKVDETGMLDEIEQRRNRVIRWFPRPEGGRLLPVPASLTTMPRAVLDAETISEGRPMRFEPVEGPALPYNWPFFDAIPNGKERLCETEEVYGQSRIGGHPRFVQEDVRQEPRLRKLSQVLLHLGLDPNRTDLELDLLISRKDLAAGQMGKAFASFDFG